MKNENNQIAAPLLIGTVVRFHAADPMTRQLGIVKAVKAGSALFPGWHYDIAWTGAKSVDSAVPAYLVTAI